MNLNESSATSEKKELSKLPQNLKESTDMTDCAFIFDGEEIRAHKLLLSCCSPVFEKMFYGKMASNRIIIADISFEDFSQMLSFIYTNTVRITSVLHAWSLIYVANKYLLDNFGAACVRYIQQNLNINNLILNYEYAEMYGIDKLQIACMSDIVDYIRGIFLQMCDYHMKATSLAKILEQKTLNISNNDLVIGVLNWAVIECDIKNINSSPENIINLLQSLKILHYLVDLDFDINSNLDILIVKSCYLIKSFKIRDIPYRIYLKKHWCIFCKCRQTYKIAHRVEMRDRDVLISNLSVNKNCLLYGLVVVTENEQIGNEKDEYRGEIRIQVSKVNSPNAILETIFCDTFSYETSVYIPLANVIYLESENVYKVKIGYKNFDNCNDLGSKKSAVLCNYMSNKLVDERKNLAFSFDELDGSVIRGISYYPA